MTPAEELREAARLMRERAQVAEGDGWPAPWVLARRGGAPAHWIVRHAKGGSVISGYETALDHIAGMHPGVALPLAELFEQAAERLEINPFGVAELIHAAQMTARAYLAPVLREAQGEGQ